MSDLVKNPETGFLTMRLKQVSVCTVCPGMSVRKAEDYGSTLRFIFEPCCKKTCLRVFRPGQKMARDLKFCTFVFYVVEGCTINVVKTKLERC